MRHLMRAGLAVALVLGIAVFVFGSSASAAGSVTVNGQTKNLDGVDVYRSSNYLVKYTPTYGATTGTNAYGFEAAVVDGKVTKVEDGVGNMAIPANGFVLSGHGTSRTWLKANAQVGVTVTEGTVTPPSSSVPPPTSSSPPPGGGGGVPETANSVTITAPGVGTSTRKISAMNVRRGTNQLIYYTPAYGARTGTNQYGTEVSVVNDTVTAIQNGVGNMTIPSNGYVLSGHGTEATWLKNYARVGATARLDTESGTPSSPPPSSSTPPSPPVSSSPPAGGTELLPDIRVHKLDRSSSQDPSGQHGFSIVTSGGAKLLKFPAVTANVGAGPLEIHGHRSSTSATDWVGNQIVKMSDGSKETLPDTGATFYYAGDGHNHWHIRDFDKYELLNSNGNVLRTGEKHGFCFEDNTSRDSTWSQAPAGPVPANPVYTHTGSCGQGQPDAVDITHGLSVGWADTYPSSLPDQAIDITSLPDGQYTVQVTADWQGFWKETSESNNSASSVIRITGNTVTFVSATNGL